MTKKRIAIVCGAIRTEIELSIILEKLLSHKQKGNLDQIVISTWEDEFKDKTSFRDSIISNGIDIVYGTGLKDGGWHNMWRQKKALYQAMNMIEKNSVVFRLRTDKSAQFIDLFIERMNKNLENSDLGIFQNKIIVTQISATIPFMIDDFVFMGDWNDIYKLTLMDETYTYISSGMDVPAEVRWFYAPIARNYPTFDAYFSKFNAVLFSNHFCNYLKSSKAEIPNQICNFFVYYWDLVRKIYEPIRKMPENKNYSYKDIFSNEPLLGIRHMNHARVISHYGVLDSAVKSYELKINLPDINSEDFCNSLTKIVPDSARKNVLRADYPKIQKSNSILVEDHIRKDIFSQAFSVKGLNFDIKEMNNIRFIMNNLAARMPFGAVLFEIGEAYAEGTKGLEQNPKKALYWWKESVSMRDPRALKKIINTYSSIEEAISVEEIQRYVASVGNRDPEIFCKVAEVFSNKKFPSKWLNVNFFTSRLDQLAAQGMKDAELISKKIKNPETPP